MSDDIQDCMPSGNAGQAFLADSLLTALSARSCPTVGSQATDYRSQSPCTVGMIVPMSPFYGIFTATGMGIQMSALIVA
jgi:hypothetical protein